MSFFSRLFKRKRKDPVVQTDTKQAKVFELAKKELGTVEWPKGDNPTVLKYFDDSGNSWVNDDETAWCAAFVGAILARKGVQPTGKLNARSYTNWGKPKTLSKAVPGDVVVLWRESPDSWKGHVAFFVRRVGNRVELLGGNQSNSVNISSYPVSRVLSVSGY